MANRIVQIYAILSLVFLTNQNDHMAYDPNIGEILMEESCCKLRTNYIQLPDPSDYENIIYLLPEYAELKRCHGICWPFREKDLCAPTETGVTKKVIFVSNLKLTKLTYKDILSFNREKESI